MFVTPRKQSSDDPFCFACGLLAMERRRIDSDYGKEKGLSELLLKFGGVHLQSGIICRNCERRLICFEQKCSDFRTMCERSCRSREVWPSCHIKRCAKSPASTPVKSKRCLISSTSDPESRPISSPFPSPVVTTANIMNTPCSLLSGSGQFFIRTPLRSLKPSPPSQFASPPQVPVPSLIPQPVPVSSLIPKPQPTRRVGPQAVREEHSYSRSEPTSTTSRSKPKREDGNSVKMYHPVIQILASTSQHEGATFDMNQMRRLNIFAATSVDSLVTYLLTLSSVRKAIIQQLAEEVDTRVRTMGGRKHNPSYLMKKDYHAMKSLDWGDVLSEFNQSFPSLLQLMLSLMLSKSDRVSTEKLRGILPRLGLVYAIMMQSRNMQLTRIQRMTSMLLVDQTCDQKVFDRLQPLGVCLSYATSLEVVDMIGGHFKDEITGALRKGNRMRLVGDNVNWSTGVRDQRQDRTGHMEHAFASAALVQTIDFNDFPDMIPQKDYRLATAGDFLPTEPDILEIRRDYAILIARVVCRLIPSFQFLKDAVPTVIEGEFTAVLKEKTKVIPLPVTFKNEQYYKDVVDILDEYEKTIHDSFEAADLQVGPETKVHIGGDQLTRERFSGAKRIRAQHEQCRDRFHHLSPITFELFHLMMNFLGMFFKQLYREGSCQEMGTMKNLQDRISRTNVKEDVKKAYDADKDFSVSLIDAYICEAVLEHFGMDSIHSAPTQNNPPAFETSEQKREWMIQAFSEVAENHALGILGSHVMNLDEPEPNMVEVDGQVFTVPLKNGGSIQLLVRSSGSTSSKVQPTKGSRDKVKDYASLILELGLLFKDLQDLIHLPDRDRGIRLLKLAMVYFKANNNLSKYAYEILRFLVHQQCTLSVKEANEVFYGLFVNTKGQTESHIPADQQMEYLVKLNKRHIKHMSSNKTERNISRRTGAIGGVSEIGEHFDQSTGVIIRAKKHSKVSSDADELRMLEDLRKVRPFSNHVGREFDSFKNIPNSMVQYLDTNHFRAWIDKCKNKYGPEIGN